MSADPTNLKRTALAYLSTGLGDLDPLTEPFGTGGAVDLPLELAAPVAPAAAPKPGARRAVPVARRGGAGRAVLVVDSTPIARKFLALRLQSLGYYVQVAEDGEQALAMVDRQAFAIVFSELALAPEDGIDGLRLCQAIRLKTDHPSGIHPALVVVTGQTGSADRVRSALAGCDAYLTKPLVEAQLITALGEVDPLFN